MAGSHQVCLQGVSSFMLMCSRQQSVALRLQLARRSAVRIQAAWRRWQARTRCTLLLLAGLWPGACSWQGAAL